MTTDWAMIRAERVVYEDEDALVIDKPAGVTLVGARDDDDLMTAARAAGEWVMPAHRIDRVTSGLVVLGKSIAAQGELTQQFRDGSVDKRYLAIVDGVGLPERGTIDLPLRAGRKQGVRVAAARESIHYDEWSLRWSASADRADATPATTTFERLGESAEWTLVRARPLTGRRHQIRIHCAWIGYPVVGDPLFEPTPIGRTRLHSSQLTFSSKGTTVVCQREPAPDFFTGFEPGFARK